eukprot:Partr_v1_DN28023_c1_g1_i3_m57567 putative be involved in pre-mRNA splicing (By similarity)
MMQDVRPSFGKPATVSTSTAKVDKRFAGWEKHTTGFGSKMLKNMGWKEGEGIGASAAKGIVEPVKTELRPKGFGLGFGKRDEPVPPADTAGLFKSRKRAADVKKKPKKRYITLEDKLAGTGISSDVLQKLTIIDGMTGKPLTSTAFDLDVWDGRDEMAIKSLPELRNNINLIFKRVDKQLEVFGQGMKRSEKDMADLNARIVGLEKSVEEGPVRIKRMTELSTLLKTFQKRVTAAAKTGDYAAALNVDQYLDLYDPIVSDYQNELKTFGLDSAIISFVAPIIQKLFLRWDPLGNPRLGLDIFSQWKKLLCAVDGEKMGTAYETMMYNSWYPTVRSCITNSWNPHQPECVIDFLELWKPHIPDYLNTEITHQLILPKLTTAVQDWKPADKRGIHTWLHPWLPIFGSLLSQVLATVRTKFSNSLIEWYPNEPHALQMLLKWRKVFSTKDMNTLVERSIVPKLRHYMQSEFTVDPRQQDLRPLDVLMDWSALVPLKTLVGILEAEFFHKWLHVLYLWLIASKSNPQALDDITQWYTEWKAFFPESIVRHPTCVAKFNTALQMMNETMETGEIEGFANGMYATAIPPTSPIILNQNIPANQAKPKVTFRDTVEHFAAKHGLLFMPANKLSRAGKQLFKFGKVSVYFEDDLVYADFGGGQFECVPLGHLLEMQ